MVRTDGTAVERKCKPATANCLDPFPRRWHIGDAYGLDRSLGGEGFPRTSTPCFDQTASLAAQPRTVTELPGGLTNRNYKVTTPDGTFVARISSGGSELLAIDRDYEYRNSVTAAAAGAGRAGRRVPPPGPPAGHRLLEGRTLTAADVADAGNIPRIAAACRRLHDGGRFGNDFDMFDIQRRYLAVARARGFRIPAGYDDLLPQFRRPSRPWRSAPRAPSRATTTCWPPTSSTTATGSG